MGFLGLAEAFLAVVRLLAAAFLVAAAFFVSLDGDFPDFFAMYLLYKKKAHCIKPARRGYPWSADELCDRQVADGC